MLAEQHLGISPAFGEVKSEDVWGKDARVYERLTPTSADAPVMPGIVDSVLGEPPGTNARRLSKWIRGQWKG